MLKTAHNKRFGEMAATPRGNGTVAKSSRRTQWSLIDRPPLRQAAGTLGASGNNAIANAVRLNICAYKGKTLAKPLERENNLKPRNV